jgi:predicted O-linked N-acetylglucosamine transferase (SPINDLY family)
MPLFDTPRFTRKLETLFATIREQQLSGEIKSFEVK